MKRLGVAALGAVIVQGVLGGLTVLFFLPGAVSTAHAGLAEIFFCLTVAIALFTSPGWTPAATDAVDDARLRARRDGDDRADLRRRFSSARRCGTPDAGLAIPDFPLMFGGLVPDHWDATIAIHFAHRVGALVVTLAIVATSAHVWYAPPASAAS